MNLTEYKPKDKVKVMYIGAGISARSKLNKMNIREDTELELVTVQPFGGPITVKVGSSEQTIGRGLAMKIGCEMID